MLKKVISIKNVGNFLDYQAKGNVELSKMALIYAENGRGKTTLSVILRSLGTNRAEYILGRRSLGIPDNENILVSILTDDGTVQYNSKKSKDWDKAVKNIEIFDSVFVNENVFSGDYVDLEHQRHLYSFVVGEQSVERVKKIDELTQKISELNSKIRDQEKDVKNLITGDTSLNEFLSLTKDDKADEQLEAKEKELRDFGEASEIRNRTAFSCVTIATIDEKVIKNGLMQTLETVSLTAEQHTLSHLQNLGIQDGENWIRQGIEHAGENCPFCGQNLNGIEIIKAYRDYFNEAYVNLKKEINSAILFYENAFSESTFRTIQEVIFTNDTLYEFWKDFIVFENIPQIDKVFIQNTWDEVKSLLLEHFQKKLLSPLEKIELSTPLVKALEKYKDLMTKIDGYNAILNVSNEQIRLLKEKIAVTKEQTLKDEIRKLKNQIMRHSAAGTAECEKYLKLLEAKDKLETEKQSERKSLDLETLKTFETYQTRINHHLEKIGVSFKIVKTKPNFKGGKASSSYAIELNGVLIELGSQEVDKPGFKNTLSDGDKNTLAFALFLAKLDYDTKLSEKIVVFDDPVNSLDRYRKNYTIEQIEKISKLTKQVIVLSHDPYFLRDLWGKFDRANTTTLCISRSGRASQIETWNIEKETDTDYILNYRQLKEYLEIGSSSAQQMRAVARCIRPTLEGYFRMKYPLDFGIGEWLGDFIKKVRLANSADALFTMKQDSLVDEIEAISEYSAKYHHKQNLNHDTEPIDDSTLRSYINRTFKIIHR
jgi:wobble nucleotide-excising tRNase